MTTIVSGSSITFNDNTTQNTSAYGGGFAFRNRIINGDMRIDQRNAGTSVTQITSVVYGVDRFFVQGSVTSKFTAQQSTTAPTGFTNSWLLTSSAATTLSSSDYYYFAQNIEGFNVADLGFGTANASTITISFWARSSLTGTFSGAVLNDAANRSYAFTFTINSANTFEYKTVTIAGDTSGTWLKTNGGGLLIRFALGAGSSFLQTAGSWGTGNVVGATGTTQLISTSGATFYITGVQLEKGSTATSFDYRPYSAELAMCQRYFQVIVSGSGYFCNASAQTSTNAFGMYTLPVTMRTAPTGSVVSGTNYYRFLANDTDDFVDAVTVNGQTPNSVIIGNSTQISNTQGRPGIFTAQNAASFVAAQAEL